MGGGEVTRAVKEGWRSSCSIVFRINYSIYLRRVSWYFTCGKL